MAKTLSIPDTIREYYDHRSGCICIALKKVNSNSELRQTIWELLKSHPCLDDKSNKCCNWALEYCIIFDDEEGVNVDGVCLRQVESF